MGGWGSGGGVGYGVAGGGGVKGFWWWQVGCPTLLPAMLIDELSPCPLRIPISCPILLPAVLIDEAGQASEVAALQPLVFGAKRCVLATCVCVCVW